MHAPCTAPNQLLANQLAGRSGEGSTVHSKHVLAISDHDASASAISRQCDRSPSLAFSCHAVFLRYMQVACDGVRHLFLPCLMYSHAVKRFVEHILCVVDWGISTLQRHYRGVSVSLPSNRTKQQEEVVADSHIHVSWMICCLFILCIVHAAFA